MWNYERMYALRKLAELSTVYRANGVPLPKKDWETGLAKLKSQDFKAFKLLRDHSIKNLKWVWAKYQNVAYGFCATTKCPNKVTDGQFYCATCKPAQGRYHRGVFSNPCLKKNPAAVKKAVFSMPEKELRTVLAEGLVEGKIQYSLRRKLLGDSYTKLVHETDK